MQMHLYFSIISRALPIFTAWGLFFSLLLSCQQYVLAVEASAVPWHDSLDAAAGPRSAPALGLCSAPRLTSSPMLCAPPARAGVAQCMALGCPNPAQSVGTERVPRALQASALTALKEHCSALLGTAELSMR